MEVSQCGVRVETSGSCNKLMMIPSKPKTPPAAINPLEYSAPGLASLSSFFFVVASTKARTRPPANMAPVVAMERYEPVAKARERTPRISTATTKATPIKTRRQGSR